MDLEQLLKKDTVLLDGAMGSMLIEYGLNQLRESTAWWNLEYPQIVQNVHLEYLHAGAEIINTNTFEANWFRMKKWGLEERVIEINLMAVELAREACPSGRLVAGNIGPTGKFLEPMGTCSKQELQEVFYQQARILERGGVDLFCIETFCDLEEAVCAIKAVRQVSQRPLMVSLTFKKDGDCFHTMMGQELGECISTLEKEKVDIIGSNCALTPLEMTGLTNSIRQLNCKIPLALKPCAGRPKRSNSQYIYPVTSEEFAVQAMAQIEAGVKMVGGCCGTTPEYIRELKKRIKDG